MGNVEDVGRGQTPHQPLFRVGPAIYGHDCSVDYLDHTVMASPDDTVCVWGGKRAVDFFFGRTRIEGAWQHREVRPCPDVDHGPVALGAQTATAATATARENDTPRFCIKLDLQHPAFDHHRNLPTPICGAVHLSVRIFMPRPFTSEASQPINDSCGAPATARSRSSATRATSVL